MIPTVKLLQPKQATGLDLHIILYSKNWYKISKKSIIEDIRKIISVYSNTNLKYVGKGDAWEYLVRTFSDHVCPYANPYQMAEWMLEITGHKWDGGFNKKLLTRKPEEVMIGALSTLDGNVLPDNFREKMLDIKFT